MRWLKRGLIYCPDGTLDWARHSFMTPCAFQKDDATIRLFGGMRDSDGVSRIGYLDVESEHPSVIKAVSKHPVLDVGKDGMFDDNGVILGDVMEDGDGHLRMYYVGFQLVKKVKFLAFTGLAFSSDGGKSFQRYRHTPVLDRTDEALYFRAIHSVLREQGIWRVWYGAGSDWQIINETPYPNYAIRTGESPDGVNFSEEGRLCLSPQEGEYRVGRPRVYKSTSGYQMLFTVDTLDKEYRIGAATSQDGVHWDRDDSHSPLAPSPSGWDSKMVCYPVMHTTPDGRRYIFYNGNDMGRSGVGYAEWTAE